MDVVYVVSKTKEMNIELRYSLRSLKNLHHDKVWIVGGEIPRTKNVFNINVGDEGYRFDNVVNKLKIICDNEEISEDFIFMHDDIFILKPLKEVPYYYRGTLEEHVESILKKFGENMYFKSISSVLEKFPKGKSFDVHTPIVFNKKKLKYILEKYGVYEGSKRSLYCNHWKVEGKQYPKGDCKLYTDLDKLDLEQEFMSVDDKVGTSKKFLELIEELFPTRSKYEVLDFYYFKMKKVQVKLHKSLYPYRNGDIVEMKFEVAERWEKKGYLEILDAEVVKTKKQIEAEKKEIEKEKGKSVAKKEKKIRTKKTIDFRTPNKSVAKRKYKRNK